MHYSPQIVVAYFRECGIPKPELEYKFHPTRKWRFDFAWPLPKVYLEVDGGIWITGRHNRGAAIKATWEKENTAAVKGWRALKCEPRDLCTEEMVKIIKAALFLT